MKKVLFICVVSMFFVGSASALNFSWTGNGDGSTWTDNDNWNYTTQLPATTDSWQFIEGGADVHITNGTTAYGYNIRMGHTSSGTSLTVDTGGTLGWCNSIIIGNSAAQSGTSVTIKSGAELNGSLRIGAFDGTGVCTIEGGTVNSTIILGYRNNAKGTLFMDGGTVTGGNMKLCRSDAGDDGTWSYVDMDGGYMKLSNLDIGEDANSWALFNLDGGLVDTNDLWLNESGAAQYATLNITGGTMVIDFTETEEGETWAEFKTRVGGSGYDITGYGYHANAVYTWDDRNTKLTLTATVPEPATIALLGLGGLFLFRRKK
jgi:hypothetical protein